MRRPTRLFAAVAVGLSLAPISEIARAGSVEVNSSTSLAADVTAVLGNPAAPSDSKSSHDTGSLTKPDVSASATASVPIDLNTFTGAGASEMHLSSSDNGFVLNGKSSASLAGMSSLAGEVRSSASIDLSFVIQDGFVATPHLSATITKVVKRDEKTSIVISRDGMSGALLARTFDDSFGGSLDQLNAGSYRVQLVTGSISTTKGIASEAGSSDFQFSVSTSPVHTTAISLPPAIWLGGVSLAVAFIARRRIAAAL